MFVGIAVTPECRCGKPITEWVQHLGAIWARCELRHTTQLSVHLFLPKRQNASLAGKQLGDADSPASEEKGPTR